jgi:hypothetical protein|tara:strand:- start:152 stop:472 length:321 start_codon:yes stop_codon:yes gene_type:complete
MIALDRQWSTARVLFLRPGARKPSRGLWAWWSDERLHWLCHIAGEGMRPHAFTISRQGFWRSHLCARAWLQHYRARPVPGLWDGRPDAVLALPTSGDQFDLFGVLA